MTFWTDLFTKLKAFTDTMQSPKPSYDAPGNVTDAGRCRLLELPVELQLQIYALVVYDSKPIMLNMPCNSSFRNRYRVMDIEEKAWASGQRHPPLQPAIARTCKAIRFEALRLFYGENVFRACYCSPKKMLPPVITWLKMIGPENREMLRNFYLYDRNQSQDTAEYVSEALTEVKKCEIVTDMRGRLEAMSGKDCCCHLVAFGNWRRMEGQIPVGREPGVPRLKLDGEK